MSPLREWRTEQEIRGIVHEEMRDALRDQNVILEKQSVVLDKIADGAQAQLLSAAILHGNPQLGLKGFVPDVLERLGNLEAAASVDRGTIAANHSSNTGRLDRLEANQHRLLRVAKVVGQVLFVDKDGKIDWRKVVPSALVTGVAGHAMLWPVHFAHGVEWAWRMAEHVVMK